MSAVLPFFGRLWFLMGYRGCYFSKVADNLYRINDSINDM